jgi:DNA-binding SARP family transcriptional activator
MTQPSRTSAADSVWIIELKGATRVRAESTATAGVGFGQPGLLSWERAGGWNRVAGSAQSLWVELLGEVGARVGDEEIVLGPPRQRAVLAMLALRANQTVSRSELIDGVWGEAAPASVEGSVHTYIYGLRRALSAAAKDLLVRTGAGYQLVLGPDDLDLAVVESRLRDARGVAASGDKSAAADQIGECLTAWRGTPLSGLPGPFAEAERVRLTELRYKLLEERADLMLAAGRHRDVITDLGEAVMAEPFRERFRAQMMLALYRSGRRADALAEFDAVRRLFIDELGLDPSGALPELHLRMLRADPGLDLAVDSQSRARSPIPSQLPHEASGFVGRTAELQQLSEWRTAAEAGSQALLISAIDGAGGIGKTSLAVRFARRVAESYPDGHLYLDLRGFDPNRPPLTSSDALDQLLGALGSASQNKGTDARSSTYRSLLSGKRVLILLDNAVSADQVRDLLPGASNCLVLITSRKRLSGLVARDGVRRLTLGVLAETEALDLLRSAVGRERINAEIQAAKALARLCGYLPLALRVAAEKISLKQDSTLRDLVENLIAERSRLDVLDVDDDEMASVRGVFSWSYKSLEPNLARTFRYLGLLRGGDVGVEAVAALIDRPITETTELLRLLSDQHLLDYDEGRFSFHDLIRVYAGELAAEEETPAERAAVVHGLLVWYMQSVKLAYLCIHPEDVLPPESGVPDSPYASPTFDTRESAYAWYEVEAQNIFALTQHAADLGEHDIAWQLAWFMYNYYYSTGLLTEWIELLNIGLSSSRQLENPVPQVRILTVLSVANSRIGQNEAAVECLELGISIARQTGNRAFLPSLLGNLASTLREMKQYAQGILYAQEAVQLAMEFDNNYFKAGCLDSLCELYVESAQPEKALDCGETGLEFAKLCGDGLIEANLLVNIAHAHRDLGDMAAGMDHYKSALDLCAALGDRYHEALAQLGVAELHRRESRYDDAREEAQRALETFTRLDGEEVDVARSFLATLDEEAAPGAI